MARTKSPEMVAVNKDITTRGGKALTELDFTREHSPLYDIANRLLKMKDGSYIYTDDEDILFTYDELISKYIGQLYNDDETLLPFGVAPLFGIDKDSPLAKRIAHPKYLHIGIGAMECSNCGERVREASVIETKINAWVNYSKLIKKFRNEIYQTFPNWNDMLIKERLIYLNSLKATHDISFVQDSSPKLNAYIHYLQKYYKSKDIASKTIHASASFLLELNLPNIDTIKIATQIAEQSALNK